MPETLDGSNTRHQGWLVPTAPWAVMCPYQGNLSRSHHPNLPLEWWV